MKKPNLFVVGGLRSGTTLLYQILKKHPDIYFPEEKDPSFFCKDFYEDSIALYGKNIYFHITSLEDYLSLFKNVKDEKVVGEATAVYLYSKAAPCEIHRFNPNAKIIILLREPVEFMYSLHSWLLNYFMEDERDFNKALDLEESRKQGLHIPKKARYPAYLFYREKTKYIDCIKNYLKYFPKEQLRIIIFEQLIGKSGQAILKDTFEFLGISSNTEIEIPVINQNKATRSKLLSSIIQSQKLKSFVRRKIPTSEKYYKLKKFFENMLFRKTIRPPLDDSFKAQLKSEYQPQILQLNHFLQENHWIRDNLWSIWDYPSKCT